MPVPRKKTTDEDAPAEEAAPAPPEAAPDPLRAGNDSTAPRTAPAPVPGINTAGANAASAGDPGPLGDLPSSRMGEAITEQRKLSGLNPDGSPAD
jgi:hypothetical protein